MIMCIKARCPRPALPMRRRCGKHLEAERNYARRRMVKLRVKRKSEGYCTNCGLKLHPDMDKERVTCLNCRENLTVGKCR